jgi:toxin ParE1/3/4
MIGDNPGAAERFIDQLPITLRAIAERPGMGSPKHFRGPLLAGIRSWRVNGFPRQLILYRPVSDGIEVLAIVHGARDLRRLLRERSS